MVFYVVNTLPKRAVLWFPSALIGILVILSGCTPTALTPTRSDGASSETDSLEPNDAGPHTPAPEANAIPEPCSVTVRSKISAAIRMQSEALSHGDFETAYGFASNSFRKAVTVQQFERVVTRQYDILLAFSSAQFGRCDVIGSQKAAIDVEIRSLVYQPVALRYDMVRDDSWKVSSVALPVNSGPTV